MKYTIEEIDAMLYALNDTIDELELNYNSDVDDRETIVHNLTQLDKIVNLLNDLKL